MGINGHAYTNADLAETAGAELAQRSARKAT
jgi:hypothetical protein